MHGRPRGPSLLHRIAKDAPLLISFASLIFAGLALKRQSDVSDMQLWTSLRQEWDHQLVRERRACATVYGTENMKFQYQNVMNFFETVGFLVHTNRLQSDLFKATWQNDFVAYFKGAKPFMDEDRKEDLTSWKEVYYLAKKYPFDPTLKTPKDFQDFFDDEKNLPSP